jgi:hypothetical protein
LNAPQKVTIKKLVETVPVAELLPKLSDRSGMAATPMRKPSSIDHERDEVLTARLIKEEDEDDDDFQRGDEDELVSEEYDDVQEEEDAFSFAPPDETIDPAEEDGFWNEVIRLFQASEAAETAEMAAGQGGAGGPLCEETDPHFALPADAEFAEVELTSFEWSNSLMCDRVRICRNRNRNRMATRNAATYQTSTGMRVR